MSIITKPEFWILLIALLLLIGGIIAFAVTQKFEWYVWLLLGLSLGLFLIGIVWMIIRYTFFCQPCNEIVKEDDAIDYNEENVVQKEVMLAEPSLSFIDEQAQEIPRNSSNKIFREVNGDFVEYTVESSQDLDSNESNIIQRDNRIMVDQFGTVVDEEGMPAIDGSGKVIKVHRSGIVTDTESVPITDKTGSTISLHSSGAIVDKTGTKLELNNSGTVVDRSGTPIKDRRGKNVSVDRSGSVKDTTGRTVTTDINGGVRDRSGIPVVAGRNGQIRVNRDRTVIDGKGSPIRDSRGGKVSLDKTNTLIDSRGRTVTLDNTGTVIDSNGGVLTDDTGNKVRDNIGRNVRLNRSGIISDESGKPIKDSMGRTFTIDTEGTVIDTKGTPVRDSNGKEVSVDNNGTIRDGEGGEVLVDKSGNVVDSTGRTVSVNDNFRQVRQQRPVPLPPISRSGSLKAVPATPVYKVQAPVKKTMAETSRTNISPPTPVYRAANYGAQEVPLNPVEQYSNKIDPNQTYESLPNYKDCDKKLVREVKNPKCLERFEDEPQTVQYREGDKLITKTTTNTRVVERVISPISASDIISKESCVDDLDDLEPTMYRS